jgi:hypothetical protein
VIMIATAWSASAAPAAEPRDPRCGPSNISAARAEFHTDYAAGRFEDADKVLGQTWARCVRGHHWLDPQTAGEISSDLALAAHRAGDDSECLDALMDYWPAARAPDPSFSRLSPTLRAAMKFNWSRCRPTCVGQSNDAVCQSIEAIEQGDKRVPGFRHIPCPMTPGNSAVALPDGACLVLLPAAKPFDPQTVDEHDPRDSCPTPALRVRRGGEVVTTPLRSPHGSLLVSPEFCCTPIDLTVDGAGRIAAEPDDNPPEGCLFGHRTAVMQDILKLERGRLVLVKQLAEPWFPAEQ